MLKNKTITFLKDDGGWYADVKGKTRAQNSMILGADKLCEAMSAGHDNVTVDFSFTNDKVDSPAEYLVKLKRIEHDPYGATYFLSGPNASTFRVPIIWICNVTEYFLGEDHPKYLFIHNITQR